MARADLRVTIDADAAKLEREIQRTGRGMMRLESQIRRTDLAAADLDRELATMDRRMEALAADKARRRADAMQALGRGMVAFGAATAAGLGLAVKAAVDWESAWAGVTKTVEGSPEQMAALEASLRGLATQLPATHAEIAGVAEAAGQLGVGVGDVASFTRVMIDLGETTNLSAGEAASALARLMNVMQTAPDDVGRLGSVLVELGNNSATTEAEILVLGQRLAAAGAIAGLSESDVLAFASTLSSVGVNAEAGGTALSKVFLKVRDAVITSSDELDVFARVAGMSAAEFARAFGADPARAIEAFVAGLGRIDEAGGSTSEVFAELGLADQRLMAALNSTAQAQGVLTEQLDLGRAAWRDNTALVEEASKRYETSAARFEIARNALVDLGIDIGGTLLPAVVSVVESGTLLVKFVSELPAPLRAAVTILGAVAGAASLAGGAFLLLAPRVAAAKTAFAGLAFATSPAGGALSRMAGLLTGPWGLAIAGGITAAGLFATGQQRAREHVRALSDSLDGQTGALTDATRAAVANALEQEGTFRRAKDAGLDLAQVLAAALGDEAALLDLRREMTTATEALVAETEALGGGVSEASLRHEEMSGAIRSVIADVSGQSAAVSEARGAWERQDEALGGVQDSQRGVQDATEAATGALGEQVDELQELIDAQREASGQVLDARAAMRRWEEAVDSARDSLEENGATLDVTTAKGRSNQDALDDIAASSWDLIESLRANGASQETLQAKMATSRLRFITLAERMGLTGKEAEALADDLGLIPSAVSTQIRTPGLADALTGLQILSRRLDTVDGRVVQSTVVRNERTNQTFVTRRVEGTGNLLRRDGGPLRLAGGGRVDVRGGGRIATGSGPRVDDVPLLGARGEYVVRASAVDRYGEGFFRALNEMRLPAFHAGGLVGGQRAGSVSVGAPRVDVTVELDGRVIDSRARVVVRDEQAAQARRVASGVGRR